MVYEAETQGWTSNEHFTVDGTLLEAWASLKSFQPKERKEQAGLDIDRRTTRQPGYPISQLKRKRIEECFGWLKTVALLGKV